MTHFTIRLFGRELVSFQVGQADTDFTDVSSHHEPAFGFTFHDEELDDV